MMEILHFADCHFDEKNHDEIELCMDYMIQDAKDREIDGLGIDAIICSGDVTNSQYLGADTKSAKTIARIFRELSDIAPVAVVTGTFSHDGNLPEILRYVSGRFPIHVSSKPEQIVLVNRHFERDCEYLVWTTAVVTSDDPRLIVTQIPPPTKEFWKNRQGAEVDNKNIGQAMGAIFSGFGQMAMKYTDVPHILNGHFTVAGARISENQLLPGSDISIGTETLGMAQAELVCLGHIHMSQVFDIPGQNGKIFYSGSIFRKDFGEKDQAKGFYIHHLDTRCTTQGNKSKFIETPTREMVQVDYNFMTDPALLREGLTGYIMADVFRALGDKGIEGTWVKLTFKLWMDEVRNINQAEIRRLLEAAGAGRVVLEIERVRRENSRDEDIIKAVTLVDKVTTLAKHRSQPLPEGLEEMLEMVETMSFNDLIEYTKGRMETPMANPKKEMDAEIIDIKKEVVQNGAA